VYTAASGALVTVVDMEPTWPGSSTLTLGLVPLSQRWTWC
jgi:hypothetical protein